MRSLIFCSKKKFEKKWINFGAQTSKNILPLSKNFETFQFKQLWPYPKYFSKFFLKTFFCQIQTFKKMFLSHKILQPLFELFSKTFT